MNKYQYHELLIAIFDRIEAEHKRLFWNRLQEEVESPFQNTGASYKNDTFEVHAYSWAEGDEDEKPNFSYNGGEFTATWYKQSHRCLEVQTEKTYNPEYMAEMLNKCLDSLIWDIEWRKEKEKQRLES